MRIVFDDGARIVFRLSGTGTEGATLRVYLERFEPIRQQQGVETQAALAPLVAIADALAGVRERTWSAAAPASSPDGGAVFVRRRDRPLTRCSQTSTSS